MGVVKGVKKTASFGWKKAIEIAIAKTLGERLLATTSVGNATLQSGIVKLGVGGYVKIHPSVNTALLIDGAEDVIQALLGRRIGALAAGVTGGGGGGDIYTRGGDIYM